MLKYEYKYIYLVGIWVGPYSIARETYQKAEISLQFTLQHFGDDINV